jgi:predicted ferric reductase
MGTTRHAALPGHEQPQPTTNAASPLRVVAAPPLRRRSLRWIATTTALWAGLLGNVAVIVWLWVHGGNVTELHRTGDVLTSLARLTGLLGAWSALVQVLLLARLPPLERIAGLDRLSVWHRWNGHVCLDLVLVHVVLSV